MRMKTPLKVVLVLAVLVFGFSQAGYDAKFYRSKLLSACRVRVEKVEFNPQSALMQGTTDATFTLAVTNPYPLSLTVKAANFKIFTGDKEVGLARMAGAQSVTIGATGRSTVPMEVEADLAQALPGVVASAKESLREMKLKDLGAMFQQVGNGNLGAALRMLPVDLRVEGTVLVDTIVGEATLNVHGSRKPVPATQAVAPVKVDLAPQKPEESTDEAGPPVEVRKW